MMSKLEDSADSDKKRSMMENFEGKLIDLQSQLRVIKETRDKGVTALVPQQQQPAYGGYPPRGGGRFGGGGRVPGRFAGRAPRGGGRAGRAPASKTWVASKDTATTTPSRSNSSSTPVRSQSPAQVPSATAPPVDAPGG
jgi:hypothetical protein